ncbi:MAG: hypothetical protein ACRBCJ_12740 [Hyphomicrobiaceae bacterium]
MGRILLSNTDTTGRQSYADQSSLHKTLHGAERLVGLGFRHWLAGYRTGNVACWEQAWKLYEANLGTNIAHGVLTELSAWVRAVSAYSRRDISVCSNNCKTFCRDECLAVSMVAASQHKTCPAMRACAFALIESAMIDEVIDQSESFALTLRCADQVLSPQSIVAAPLSEIQPMSEYPQ